ncbi:cupin [Legionella quinlivanii]|uniref:Cupin n=1 Tax=Legionella quinlivanii TaxID=45073 RepID=A0A0W0Y0H6_9GAMM|nr:cupin domain-containing protein [Legionella quinlivanii]KTD50046.1 cupin [Legionella quinlivanii]SEF93557.1 50S ribosomal protein L16 3-hydroxylase [Legionella quinlivanii DSM 21216]STY11178.1 cupin [Legionella quinlivanii]
MKIFDAIEKNEFLENYWQQKPFIFRQAFGLFNSPLSGDELAGLAMEEEIESRLVWQTPGKTPHWHLKRGPFSAGDFKKLPVSHWTLLVQAVDRFVPEVAKLLDAFNFLPQWRIDDVMISYATEHGGVGPHYDNYDVFLLQAKGRRRWLLTTQNCQPDNYLPDLELRIMSQFEVEEEYILEEGDMLYLPPHVAHNGISLSEECMTYSFGYRSYQARELWDSFSQHCWDTPIFSQLYKDPNWSTLKDSAEIPQQAVDQARDLLKTLIDDNKAFSSWFGKFVTGLDEQAEAFLPCEMQKKKGKLANYLKKSRELARNPFSRFAYYETPNLELFINGERWNIQDVSPELVKLIARQRIMSTSQLSDYSANSPDISFLNSLWEADLLEPV